MAAASASAADLNGHALLQAKLRIAEAGPAYLRTPPRDLQWTRNRLLGDALGTWLGIHNGRWDMFDEPAGEGPAICGTVRKNAAEIQLRWHPDE
ncbi:MAG: hypothetical protein KGJ79_16695 [Alphaproteobacteria bacterium]|nr:hypothetical protein [Alphaproteobacteria bacterium]MDE2112781.1 hypothetical protein [Alphaproteobacteria bacterium]MDE2493294.1 hypothetical protein [Alphaproteobacteria bacterium]